MKRTKPAVPLLPGVVVFVIGLILFASLRWYGIWPTSSGRDYDYAIPIQVDYSIYGLTQGFELFRDITPYADPQLREKLIIRELTPKDQVYAYDIASDKELSKIYSPSDHIYRTGYRAGIMQAEGRRGHVSVRRQPLVFHIGHRRRAGVP